MSNGVNANGHKCNKFVLKPKHKVKVWTDILKNLNKSKITSWINVGKVVRFTYLEVQDDSPDETKNKFRVAIDDIFCTNVYKFNLKKIIQNFNTE